MRKLVFFLIVISLSAGMLYWPSLSMKQPSPVVTQCTIANEVSAGWLPTAHAQDLPVVRCWTVQQVCHDIYWEQLYALCLGTGNSKDKCMSDAAVGYYNCVTAENCGV